MRQIINIRPRKVWEHSGKKAKRKENGRTTFTWTLCHTRQTQPQTQGFPIGQTGVVAVSGFSGARIDEQPNSCFSRSGRKYVTCRAGSNTDGPAGDDCYPEAESG